jgi:tetratricopeptide (TPR) repeat protein
VRAKLALRAGKADEAAQAYAQAAKAFPASEEWGQNWDDGQAGRETIKPHCRIEGERGTLALSRGEYLAAMEHLYAAAPTYWTDAAYIAERVLKLDELKSFVDAHVPAAMPAKPVSGEDRVDMPPATSLRTLLARRLLRAERFDEALGYFDDAELKKKAQTYVDARRTTARGDHVEQAQAWYAAARAARFDGIDILGYELDPDYQMYGGSFDLGEDAAERAGVIVMTAEPPARKDVVVPKTLAGPDEAARVTASRAQPLQRFHYRYTAADLASKSADLLPPRTQAFAAVLCNATAWLLVRDPPAAAKFYTRYVKQGPHVPWGAAFGQSCPAPDFAGAAARLRAERMAWWKHTIKRNAPYAAIGVGLLLFGIWWGRRKRRSAR